MKDTAQLEVQLEGLRNAHAELRAALQTQFFGHAEVCELLLIALFADGHVLLEGAPGLGKTTLVRAVASSVDLEFRRVQFTPDLMPPDILGTRILDLEQSGGRSFRFEAGPIFTNVLLADEINRATPRTQAALLEAMQEHQVTLFGETRKLEDPFLVIATQNPIEMEGTYPLPEAQLDRFLFKLELSLPSRAELSAILSATTGNSDAAGQQSVVRREQVRQWRAFTRCVPASTEMVELTSALIHATHPTSEIAPDRIRALVRYGASPRGGQAILLAAKTRALLDGRLCVSAADIEALAAPALRHRILLGYEGEAAGVHPDELVADALAAARRVRR